MLAKVQKWGNSLGLRIPKSLAADANLANGSPVELAVRAGRLVVTPVARPRYALEDLLAAVTANNAHRSEWADGFAGREPPL